MEGPQVRGNCGRAGHHRGRSLPTGAEGGRGFRSGLAAYLRLDRGSILLTAGRDQWRRGAAVSPARGYRADDGPNQPSPSGSLGGGVSGCREPRSSLGTQPVQAYGRGSAGALDPDAALIAFSSAAQGLYWPTCRGPDVQAARQGLGGTRGCPGRRGLRRSPIRRRRRRHREPRTPAPVHPSATPAHRHDSAPDPSHLMAQTWGTVASVSRRSRPHSSRGMTDRVPA